MAKSRRASILRSRPLVLCDTNIIIHLLRRKPLVADEIHAIGENRILICPVIAGEVYAGMLKREYLPYLRSLTNLPKRAE